MAEDAYWYEAAFVAGVTNALNVAADGLITAGVALIEPVNENVASENTQKVFVEIREFYGTPEVPLVFRVMARDPIYAASFWKALRRAFSDNQLTRRVKEALGFAVSLTTRSAFGTELHLAQMRRCGVTDAGVMEIVGVTQMFSSYTKIADTLQLQPDMGHIAPVDPAGVPGR
jgi:alkylhydroperoxidase/carboxymuconolactone decarboxylase family protein YurZ